jgi:hypothetical protein
MCLLIYVNICSTVCRLAGAESCGNLGELLQSCREVVGDFRCQNVRWRQRIGIGQAFIFDPEEIEAELSWISC